MRRRDGPAKSLLPPNQPRHPWTITAPATTSPKKIGNNMGVRTIRGDEFLGIRHMTVCSVEAGHAAGISWRSAWNCGEQADIAAFHHTRQRIQHPRHIPFRRAPTLSFSAFNDSTGSTNIDPSASFVALACGLFA
jgi:hypothetical protein